MDNSQRQRARAQLISSLEPIAPGPAPGGPPEIGEAVAATQGAAASASPPRPAAQARKHTSITIPLPVFRKLREIAYFDETSINDVILRAVDELLEKRGALERSFPKGD